jgi:hypothetical protein
MPSVTPTLPYTQIKMSMEPNPSWQVLVPSTLDPLSDGLALDGKSTGGDQSITEPSVIGPESLSPLRSAAL